MNPTRLRPVLRSVAARDAAAVELRVNGATYEAIASDLGMSRTAAFNAVSRGLRRWAQPNVDELIRIESERLDRLVEAFIPRALAGDVEAAGVVLRVAERRARLFGLDSPKRIDVSMIVAQWAEREGLDPVDVIDAVPGLFAILGGGGNGL